MVESSRPDTFKVSRILGMQDASKTVLVHSSLPFLSIPIWAISGYPEGKKNNNK